MESMVQIILTIIGSVAASSGFWTYCQKRFDKTSLQNKMLIGLAHDRIIYLGVSYIERGWVSAEEYENIYKYLFAPYEKLGGNGSAHRIMEEVKRLPICKDPERDNIVG